MGTEYQAPPQPAANLTTRQVKTFQKMEPKALGSIQIIIAVLCLCLSISVLQIYYEVHFTPDLIVVVVIVVQILASGSILIHAGRFPSLFWVKATLAVHLVSAAFTTAALGLLSRHLPYRQDSYHCEHCRRLEIYAVLLIDGFLTTLVLFLVVELIVCIVTVLFGLSVLTKGGLHLPGVVQHIEGPPARPVLPHPEVAPAQVEVVEEVMVPEAAHAPETQLTEASTPPTEPQVEPIDSIAEV
ncbi:high affinity immunoglobulin epsilon receptor subunit beta isoform X2 [Silurus meridionalis]|uniref:high affinity immunoglobulin epsilon receptor subunit beta isoform X2 n=1 Tax=Silurus meridionalis TaxID=175797 RepID=UPI001EEAA173|nr:high affinity immunoglobulin epsilon receptor subunit beta isoform X2 [Silurus meridionalis]